MNPEDSDEPPKSTHSRRAFLKELGVFSAKTAAAGWGTDVIKKVDDTRRIYLAEQSLSNKLGLKSHFRLEPSHHPNTEGLDTQNLIISGETQHWMTQPIPDNIPEESTFFGGAEMFGKREMEKNQAIYNSCKAVFLTDGLANMPFSDHLNANSVSPEVNVLVNQFIRHWSGAAIGGAIAVGDRRISRRTFLGIATGATLGLLTSKVAKGPADDFLAISDVESIPDEITRELWKSVLPLNDVQIDIRNRSMILNTLALNPIVPNLSSEKDEILFQAGNGHEQEADLLQHEPKNLEREFKELMDEKIKGIIQTSQQLVDKYEQEGNTEKVIEAKVKSSAFLAALILQSAYPPTILINNKEQARSSSLFAIRANAADLSRPHTLSAFVLTMLVIKQHEPEANDFEREIYTNALSYTSSFINDAKTEYRYDNEKKWEAGFPVAYDVGEQNDLRVFGTKIRHVGGIVTKVQ